jgi:hypothetical protein
MNWVTFLNPGSTLNVLLKTKLVFFLVQKVVTKEIVMEKSVARRIGGIRRSGLDSLTALR